MRAFHQRWRSSSLSGQNRGAALLPSRVTRWQQRRHEHKPTIAFMRNLASHNLYLPRRTTIKTGSSTMVYDLIIKYR